MTSIKKMAIKTMELGFYNESLDILKKLVDAQCIEMGLLHEETLSSIELLAYNFALLRKWDSLSHLYELLNNTQQQLQEDRLQATVQQIASIRRSMLAEAI